MLKRHVASACSSFTSRRRHRRSGWTGAIALQCGSASTASASPNVTCGRFGMREATAHRPARSASIPRRHTAEAGLVRNRSSQSSPAPDPSRQEQTTKPACPARLDSPLASIVAGQLRLQPRELTNEVTLIRFRSLIGASRCDGTFVALIAATLCDAGIDRQHRFDQSTQQVCRCLTCPNSRHDDAPVVRDGLYPATRTRRDSTRRIGRFARVASASSGQVVQS